MVPLHSNAIIPCTSVTLWGCCRRGCRAGGSLLAQACDSWLFMVLPIFPFSEDTLVRETGMSPCTSKTPWTGALGPRELVQRTCLSQGGSLIGITPSYISLLLVFPKHSKSLAIDQARFCLRCPQQTWRAIGYQLTTAHSDARALQC